MTYDEYINETTALGFLQKGKDAYGEYNGFPVHCVFNGKSSAKVISVIVTLDKTVNNKFVKALNKAIKGMGTAAIYAANNTGLSVVVNAKENFMGNFRQIMDQLRGMGPEYDMRVPSVCPFCHGAGCDGNALMKNLYTPVHRSCLEQVRQGVSAKAERNLKEGSYVSGFFGGLAGGIIATVPTILTILLMERIFAVLMWLVPMGVAFGYKKCNGKRSKAAGPIMIVLSLLSMYVMEYVFWLIAFADAYGFGGALQLTLPFLLDPAFWVEMTKGAVTELVFLVLAIIMSWKSITETAADDVSSVDACLNTYQAKPYAQSRGAEGCESEKESL